MNPEGCVYYPGGKSIRPGTITRLPGLANALEEFAARGAAFLDGPLGTAITERVRQAGGVLTNSDFAYARAEWTECASVVVASTDGDVTAWATPAPTHGPSLLDAMSHIGGGTSKPAEVFAAVMKAIQERRQTLADPSGTSMVSAADADGNVVVIVHSNSFPRFGSGIVVPEYDLTLANRAGRGFTPEPGHPNFPVAGRRPATTLHAWAVAGLDGRPRFVGATPGGANQMPWNAQTISRIAGGEHRPGMLVTAPIWEWLPEDDGLRVEAGFDPDELAELRAKVTRSVLAPRWGCKSAQQVIRIPRGDEPWSGAADPRTVGAALGVC
jgi:gamma-glutamyltranspeptidase/glutathione hydrolase